PALRGQLGEGGLGLGGGPPGVPVLGARRAHRAGETAAEGTARRRDARSLGCEGDVVTVDKNAAAAEEAGGRVEDLAQLVGLQPVQRGGGDGGVLLTGPPTPGSYTLSLHDALRAATSRAPAPRARPSRPRSR